jgi:EasF-like predicted methyltransferase
LDCSSLTKLPEEYRTDHPSNLRKIKILLSALDRAGINVEYYALDLDKSELQRTLAMIPSGTFKHVSVHGLHGTYDDGQRWLQQNPHARQKPKVVLSLGSTIGSFSRAEAANFLACFAECVQGEGGTGSVLLAVDGCKDGEKVWRAYNDNQGLNERFISNALKHANRILKYEAFKEEDWTVQGEWNSESGSHDWYYIPRKDVVVEGTRLTKGERVCAVKSYKYDGIDRLKLYRAAGVEETNAWTLHGKDYGMSSHSGYFLDFQLT